MRPPSAAVVVLLLALVPAAGAAASPAPASPKPASPAPAPSASAPSAPAAALPGSRDPLSPARLAAERAAVVRIDGAGGTGTGFLFRDRRTVATAFHVVALGRAPRVTTADGRRLAARVTAWDPATDLALLTLERPLRGAAPLAAGAPDAVPLGAPVVVLGNPWVTLADRTPALAGLLGWSVTRGILSARGRSQLQFDAAISPGSSGSPLFGPDGRVLGVVDAEASAAGGIGFAVRIEALTALAAGAGHQGVYRGPWSVHLGLSLLAAAVPLRGGLSASVRLVGHDRWLLQLTGAILFGGGPADPTLWAGSSQRATLEVAGGYRFRVADQAYLVPTLGLFGGTGTVDATRLALRLADPGCDLLGGATCPVDTVRQTTETRERLLGPTVGLRFFLGAEQGFEVGYALQLDLAGGRASHLVTLGLQL